VRGTWGQVRSTQTEKLVVRLGFSSPDLSRPTVSPLSACLLPSASACPRQNGGVDSAPHETKGKVSHVNASNRI
jgi:hypothetical protein